MDSPASLKDVLGQTFDALNIRTVFTVPGVPITETLNALIKEYTLQVCSMKHECHATNAAGAYGYQAGRYCYEQPMPPYAAPGVVITTCGPGFLNAASQFVNLTSNRFPTILISSSHQNAGKAEQSTVRQPLNFQAMDQLGIAEDYVKRGLVKAAYSVTSFSDVPRVLSAAWRMSLEGAPGPVYVDIPWALWSSKSAEFIDYDRFTLEACVDQPVFDFGSRLAEILQLRGKTLLVYGDGLNPLVNGKISEIPLPVLPTSSAKAFAHAKWDVRACRSKALKECDTAIFVGASFDWKFDCTNNQLWSGKRVITVGYNQPTNAECAKHSTQAQILNAPFNETDKITHFETSPAKFLQLLVDSKITGDSSCQPAWNEALIGLAKKRMTEPSERPVMTGSLMGSTRQCTGVQFRDVYNIINDVAAENSNLFYVSEGATSLDQARKFVNLPNMWDLNLQPELSEIKATYGRWMDPGSYGSMGIGLPFAIGMASWSLTLESYHPNLQPGRVIATLGDSAAGFTGMELETIARYKLPIAVLVLDNGGIYAVKPTRLSEFKEPINPLPSKSSFIKSTNRLHVDVTDLKEVDWAGIMPSITGSTIQNLNQLNGNLAILLEELFKTGAPQMIHVKCDPRDGSGLGFIANHH